MTTPLKWQIDWENRSFKERFLMGSPVGATEERVRADIIRQLNERSEADLAAWDRYPDEIRLLAGKLSGRLQAEAIWPSSRFLPDDPADIPLGDHFGETDPWDFLPAAFSIVEKEFGLKMDMAFWNTLPKMTYAQAIEQMARKHGAADAPEGDKMAPAEHRFLKFVLPAKAFTAVKAGTKLWLAECPCGHRQDLWDAGRVRYKASGNACELLHCPACGHATMHKIQKK